MSEDVEWVLLVVYEVKKIIVSLFLYERVKILKEVVWFLEK